MKAAAADTSCVVLTRDAISAARLAATMAPPEAGAVVTFEGLVRAERDAVGRRLTTLDYEAYEAMAAEQLARLRETAIRDFRLFDARLAHRLGPLEIGTVAVAVVATAGHRAAAFDGCRWLIDAIKADVPIWKREIWSDGSRSGSDATAEPA